MDAIVSHVHTKDRGYVFATDGTQEILLHANDFVDDGFAQVELGCRVECDVTDTPKGLKAANIRVVSAADRHIGTISKLGEKSFGFITVADGRKAFFAYLDCQWFIHADDLGRKVEFDLVTKDRGLAAERIVLLTTGREPTTRR